MYCITRIVIDCTELYSGIGGAYRYLIKVAQELSLEEPHMWSLAQMTHLQVAQSSLCLPVKVLTNLVPEKTHPYFYSIYQNVMMSSVKHSYELHNTRTDTFDV